MDVHGRCNTACADAESCAQRSGISDGICPPRRWANHGLLQETPHIKTLLVDGTTALVVIERGQDPAPPPRGRVAVEHGARLLVINPAAPAAEAEPPFEWPWACLWLSDVGSAGGAAVLPEGKMEPPPTPAPIWRGRCQVVKEGDGILILGD